MGQPSFYEQWERTFSRAVRIKHVVSCKEIDNVPCGRGAVSTVAIAAKAGRRKVLLESLGSKFGKK